MLLSRDTVDAMAAEDFQIGQAIYLRPSRVVGPIHGGELQVTSFGILITTGNEASIARFYNGRQNEVKQLREILGGNIWVRDERY